MPREKTAAIGETGWRPTEVHPLADLFPMMHDDELAELAEDIASNGLLHPIMIDADGVLIDGRNRLAACERAGVEPEFQQLNGYDPASFIVSMNLTRRNLSKGQQAMALAMIYPEAKRGRPGGNVKNIKISELDNSERVLLSQARTILRHSRELAEGILHGGIHFDVAWKQVKEETHKRLGRDAQMAQLRTHASDVAALVEDGRLTLEAGLKELGERQRAIRHRIEAGHGAAARVGEFAGHVLTMESAVRLTDAELAMVGCERRDANPLAALSRKDIDGLLAGLRRLVGLKGDELEEEAP